MAIFAAAWIWRHRSQSTLRPYTLLFVEGLFHRFEADSQAVYGVHWKVKSKRKLQVISTNL
jgi:hypothetical protein